MSCPLLGQRLSSVGGCTFAEEATIPACQARLFLSAGLDPMALAIHADTGRRSAAAFDLSRLAALANVAIGPDGTEYVALSNGCQWLRIDILAGSLLSGPVGLRFANDRASGLADLAKALSMLAFLTTYRRFPALPRQHQAFAERQIALLRTYDALVAGASQRDVAIALFGSDRVIADWNGPSDAMRSTVRRLCKSARVLAKGGHRDLLRRAPR
jgi:hypothetical protein